MADRRDIHCILNNESIQDDTRDLMLAASSNRQKSFIHLSLKLDQYFIHDKMITNMTFLHRLLKTSELKQ